MTSSTTFPAAVPSTGAAALQRLPITWSGSPWSLTGLAILNFFLTIITLGIYSFWGRTEVRKRIWSAIHVDDEPLAYTGTGKEMFIGFLMVFLILLLPILLIGIGVAATFGPNSGPAVGFQLLAYVGFFYLVGVATHRARRYRLSRTRWRGIRGALEGSAWGYGWTYFWTAALMLAVFVLIFAAMAVFGSPAFRGVVPAVSPWLIALLLLVGVVVAALIAPWRATRLVARITNDMRFGSRPFNFVGTARPLYARFIARWIGVLLLAVATLAAIYFWIGPVRLSSLMVPGAGPRRLQLTGTEIAGLVFIGLLAFLGLSIVTAWYKAVEANYFASATRYENVPFKLSISAGGLIWLVVTNFLLALLSLGILRPVAQARSARYFVENLALDGLVDAALIAQSDAKAPKTGEGLAQVFDVDAF